MRELTECEIESIKRFSRVLPQVKRDQLLMDLDRALVKVVSEDGCRIIFDITGYSRPPYIGQHLIGAEGRMLDCDGNEMTVCVYVDQNDRLLELEIISWGDAAGAPNWGTLVVF